MLSFNSIQPLVSVVIPAYNVEKYIEECLSSIQKQTYTSWEIIVVDDASQDKTIETVRQFIQKTNTDRIKLISNSQNLGLPATRNVGIQESKGEYIALLDADDLWEENFLEISMEFLNKSAADVAYSTMKIFDDKDKSIKGYRGPSKKDLEEFPISLFLGKNLNYIQCSAAVIKKEVVEKVGLFDISLRNAEDFDYWLRAVEAGLKFVYIPGFYSLLRRNHSSLTSNWQRCCEYHAKVLRKHRNFNLVPFKERRNIVSSWQLMIAKNNLRNDPLKSVVYFFWAWMIRPEKVKYLGAIIIALYLHVSMSLRKTLIINET